MNEEIATLKQWIRDSDNIVFFGGAGVSTESGIPDFRSVDGLYNQKWKYPPETILSHSFFERYPEEYFRFHRGREAAGGRHPEYRRAAPGRRQQKGAGAARQHPARLLLPLP